MRILEIVFCLCFVRCTALPATPPETASSFYPNRLFETGGSPAALVMADVNGDALLDILTANTWTHDISVLLRRTDGLFGAERRFGAGFSPAAIAAADVNHDGNIDIVVVNANADARVQGVSVLLGDGTGSFSQPRRLTTGARPSALALGDLDGDGSIDMVVANTGSDNLTVLRGQGTGEFTSSLTLKSSTYPGAVFVLDLNRDGKLDIIAVGQDKLGQNITIYLGLGGGAFLDARYVSLQPPDRITRRAVSACMADVNGDGQPDLVLATVDTYPETQGISVLLGNSDGTFGGEIRSALRFGSTWALAVGDLNGDGKADLVGSTSYAVEVLAGEGNGAFRSELRVICGNSPLALLVSDMDGDGRNDIVFTGSRNAVSDALGVLYARGDGSFGSARHYGIEGKPRAVAAADVNGDGIVDLLSANEEAGTVTVLAGFGNGTFQHAGSFSTGSPSSPTWLEIADLNHDGFPDLVTGNLRGSGAAVNDLSVLIGQPGGGFGTALQIEVRVAMSHVLVADYDADGNPDIVVSNAAAPEIIVFAGTGKGLFGAARRIALSQAAGPVKCVAVHDMNGDGLPDLVAARATGSVSISYGKGSGEFGGEKVFPLPTAAIALAVADFNRDGFPDIVASLGSRISVLLAVSGSFGDALSTPAREFAGMSGLAVADVTGDGYPDVLTGHTWPGGNDISLFIGQGDGTLQPEQRYGTGVEPASVVIADLDGDGLPDIAAACTNRYFESISVLFHRAYRELDQTQALPFRARKDATASAAVYRILKAAGESARAPASPASLISILGTNFAPTTAGGATKSELFPSRLLAVEHAFGTFTIGDLNRDGIPDIVGIGSGSLPADTAVVLLRNAEGEIVSEKTYRTGRYSGTPVITDLDGDGRPDIAVPSRDALAVTLLFGSETGEFTAQSITSNDVYPVAMAASDLNADGRMDLLLLTSTGYLWLAMGTGPRMFAPLTRHPDRFGEAGTLFVVDLNGDNRPDVLTSEGTVFLNQNGVLGNARRGIANDGGFTGISALVDLNNDHILDAVMPTSTALGVGDGTFTRRRSLPEPISFVSPFPLIGAADFDGDGRVDLVGGRGDILMLQGAGDGTFALNSRVPAPEGSSWGLIDADGDGDLDILTARGSQAPAVSTNIGAGRFLAPVYTSLGGYPVVLSVRDVNGDHQPDLITTVPVEGVLMVLPGLGNGQFGTPQTTPVGLLPRGLAFADLDCDGIDDVVTANSDGNDITILIGGGDGSFPFRRQFPAGYHPAAVAAGDVDGDGVTDVVVLNDDGVGVLAGNGDGSVKPVRSTLLSAKAQTFDVADLDGDGRADLALGLSSGEVRVFTQYRDSTFGAVSSLSTGVREQITSVRIADFNADGIPDIVAGSSGKLHVMIGTGGAAYTSAIAHSVQGTPQDIQVADVTGDGILDVVAVLGMEAVVLPGGGDGTFAPPKRFGITGGRVAVADVTSDGKPDLVVLAAIVTVLPGQ